METEKIIIKGARQHNLKNIDVEIPRNSFTVITGLSGSGKSSLAFDTIYAEGQRRYIECLSAYARQFLDMLEKPDVDSIEGLSPAISIEQKASSGNPRSTVGTVTEIYDYLRLLYARVGIAHCYNCGKPVAQQTSAQIIETIIHDLKEKKILILAPVVRGRKGHYRELFEEIQSDG
ncbi:MAG: excinuclease ABC subunit UvrA, partial [Ignavibacteria bacterium]|nr:excinuclease ABC subunit UvrA [Ignavibacteria bacterium]